MNGKRDGGALSSGEELNEFFRLQRAREEGQPLVPEPAPEPPPVPRRPPPPRAATPAAPRPAVPPPPPAPAPPPPAPKPPALAPTLPSPAPPAVVLPLRQEEAPETEQEPSGGEGSEEVSTELFISEDLSFPAETSTQSLAVVASKGSGKTYLTAVMVEEMLEQGIQVVIFDPLGVYWGLRSLASGLDAGYPIPIFGGDHGDVPLDVDAGRAVARFIHAGEESFILDLSSMRKHEQRTFVADFTEELYAQASANRKPLHLIVDEADLFIPQQPGRDAEARRALDAFEDHVRRGRAFGLGITVVTQRPAVIHKDILTQVGTLVVLRMLGPQDRNAIEEWIKYNGDPSKMKQVLGSLGSLPIGTAWVWSPGWLGVLKKIRVRKKVTFDSSVTPTGEIVPTPKGWATVDVEAIRDALSDAIRTDPNDPKVLKLRILELERALELNIGSEAGAIIQRLENRVADLERELFARGKGNVSIDAGTLTELLVRTRQLMHSNDELGAKVTELLENVEAADAEEDDGDE